jgi:hypothetical protein
MPTYLYFCEVHDEFEEFHSASIKLEHCPLCEKDNVKTEVKRLICGTNRGVVELYGQDLVDKVKADANQLKRDASKSEKIYANILGEDKYNSVQSRIDKQKRGY